MKKLKWPLAILGLLAVTALVLRRRSRPGSTPLARGSSGSVGYRGYAPSPAAAIPDRERRAEPDPVALAAVLRGPSLRVGVDLAKLKALQPAGYRPLVEYLEYIQVQRGGGDALLFVRGKDLDELAARAGKSRETFTREFKRLGVMLSMN